jgi:hypothetical protein
MAKTTSTTSTSSTTPSTGLADPIGIGETSPRDPLSEAGQEATESIGQLTERATDLGYRQADTRREQVAHGLEELAGGIRRVSSDLEVQQPAVATIAQTAAEQTDRIARYLQETDARQLVSNVEDLARRQPLLFLGGAFLLGMAASRLIKAGTGTDVSGSSYVPAYRASGGYQATGPGGYGTERGTAEGL